MIPKGGFQSMIKKAQKLQEKMQEVQSELEHITEEGQAAGGLVTIVANGKKEIKSGIVVGFSIFEDKVGIAIGVSKDLTTKYDAVYLVKIASEILGGKGGGGRKDFAQAGGINRNKIDEAYNKILKKIS